MVKHTAGKKLVCFGLVVLNVRVFSVQCGVLDNIKVANVYGVLHRVWGVGVKKIFIEGEGGRITLRGGVKAVAFYG